MTPRTSRWLLGGSAAFLLLTCACCGLPVLPETLFYLAFGWALFLYHVLPGVQMNVGNAMLAAVLLAVFTIGLHAALGWLYRARQSYLAANQSADTVAPVTPPTWRWKWTAAIVSVTLLAFVAGISTVGVTHQVAWLATSEEGQARSVRLALGQGRQRADGRWQRADAFARCRPARAPRAGHPRRPGTGGGSHGSFRLVQLFLFLPGRLVLFQREEIVAVLVELAESLGGFFLFVGFGPLADELVERELVVVVGVGLLETLLGRFLPLVALTSQGRRRAANYHGHGQHPTQQSLHFDLLQQKEYGDFILELEFKVDPRLNSGVQIRSQVFDKPTTSAGEGGEVKRIPAGRVHGYQFEIDNDPQRNRLWSGGIYDEGRRGWLYPGLRGGDGAAFTEQGRKITRLDDWNTLRVEAVGDSLKTYLNGELRADFKDDLTPKGFIALQVHGVGDKTDKLQVRWRNIRLSEVKAP